MISLSWPAWDIAGTVSRTMACHASLAMRWRSIVLAA
jgi:hypothetical protein